MATTCHLQPLPPAGRARMRAVIAEGDPVRRTLLRRVLLSEAAFDLVAEAAGSDELLQTVERALPELVIGSFAGYLEHLDAQQAFPVLITAGSGRAASERVLCDLALPLQQTEAAEAVASATSRILRLKGGELSSLVRNYLAYGDEVRPRLQRIAVCDGDRQTSVRTEDILWIKAAGNYVQLHTRTGAFELRDTLSNLAAKLESSGFARIRRGVVVNIEAIKHRSLHDGMVAAVVLEDGNHFMVGRKFRHRLPGHISNTSILPMPQEPVFELRMGRE